MKDGEVRLACSRFQMHEAFPERPTYRPRSATGAYDAGTHVGGSMHYDVEERRLRRSSLAIGHQAIATLCRERHTQPMDARVAVVEIERIGRDVEHLRQDPHE